MSHTLEIVGLCGSLRKASLNRAALRLAGESMPSTMTLDIVDWREFPVFDGDVFALGLPAPVAALRERIRRADGVVVATPEYNFSVPGGLKNVLDWLSRGDDQPWTLKPVAILSASTGPVGGARVQYDLRKVMLYLNAAVLVKPEVFIGQAQTKFDAEGRCTDETTRKFVGAQMVAFQQWITAVGRMRGPGCASRRSDAGLPPGTVRRAGDNGPISVAGRCGRRHPAFGTALSAPGPVRRALFDEGRAAFLGVFGQRQSHDLGFKEADRRLERHVEGGTRHRLAAAQCCG
jgi:chromate reductase